MMTTPNNSEFIESLKRANIKKNGNLINWAFKTFYSDPKATWYDPNVHPGNVLSAFKTPKTPITFFALMKLWNLKKELQSNRNLKERKSSNSSLRTPKLPPKNPRIYSNESMSNISKEIGCMNHSAIQTTISTGIEKIKKLTKNKSWKDVPEEEFEKLNNLIDEVRKISAKEYVHILNYFKKGKISKFLEYLVQSDNMTKKDLKFVSVEEIEALYTLSKLKDYKMKELLLRDIENEDNVFKTYQNLVSRNIFLVLEENVNLTEKLKKPIEFKTIFKKKSSVGYKDLSLSSVQT